MEASLKLVRIVWVAMLVAALLYVWIPEQVHVEPHELVKTIYWAIVLLAIGMLAIAMVLRGATIGRAQEILRTNPSDAGALGRWRMGQIITFAICEAIVLYGLVLRFMGATLKEAAPLYVLGICAMLLFRPQPVQ